MKRCKHGWVYCWGANESGQTVRRFECTYQYALVSVLARFVRPVAMIECSTCGHTLSLGPANDSVKPAPLPRREMADFRDTGWSWDPSRPIAEQLAETARDDAAAEALVAIAEKSLSTPAEFDPQAAAAFVCGDGVPTVMLDAQERSAYEASRAAEPDCRDEDYGPNPIGEHIGDDTAPSCRLGAKDPNEDAMRDPAVTAHNAEVIAQRLIDKAYEQCETMRREAWKANAPVRAAARRIIESWPDDNTPTPQATDEVCACTGDALLSEKCEVVP